MSAPAAAASYAILALAGVLSLVVVGAALRDLIDWLRVEDLPHSHAATPAPARGEPRDSITIHARMLAAADAEYRR